MKHKIFSAYVNHNMLYLNFQTYVQEEQVIILFTRIKENWNENAMKKDIHNKKALPDSNEMDEF